MYSSFLFALALMASLCTDALAAGGYGHDNKYAVRNYNARIGHAGGPHRKRAAAAAKKLARGRARRRTPVIAEEPGVVHIPLQPVSARDAHSFKKHRHHAVRRHKMVMAVKSTNSTSSSSPKDNSRGASKKEVQAALDDTITAPSGTAAKDSLGLSIEGADVGYFASLKIGTPGRTFKILMDSGSADFWVPSEDCSDAECGKHTQLGSKSSSTFKSSTQQFDITYGTGEVAGTLAEDTIDIAGLNLTGHTFGVTTAESQQFSDSTVPFDGLMGLAQSKLSEQGTLTPIEAMKKAGVVKQAVMGYALGRVADDTNIGQVTFGGVDSTKFTGSLTTVKNVSPDGFWEADVAAITVDGKSVLTSKTAVMDTGTTLIVAPPKDAVAVHKAIPGAKSLTGSDGSSSFVIPCTTNATVAFKIGNKSFLVAPEDLAFLPVDQNDLTGDCQSAITAGEIDGDDTWLLGDSFLKSNYLSTDVDANTIGLAPSKSG